MTESFWTKERMGLLADLHGRGWSTGQMAKELNATRNMVVGKCNRMGLPLKRQATYKKEGRPQKAPPAPQDDRSGVSVLDAGLGHCRWPISPEGAPYRFCGAPRIFPHSWCAVHGKQAYRLPPADFLRTEQAVTGTASPGPAAATNGAATTAAEAEDDTAESEGQVLETGLSDSRDRDQSPPFDDAPELEEGVSWITSSG